jgi:hypothetical protein
MKKILNSLGAFLCFGNAVAPSNSLDERLERVDQKSFTSGIIYDRVLPLADLAIFNMSGEKSHNTDYFRFLKF